jgi:hypothetical protein
MKLLLGDKLSGSCPGEDGSILGTSSRNCYWGRTWLSAVLSNVVTLSEGKLWPLRFASLLYSAYWNTVLESTFFPRESSVRRLWITNEHSHRMLHFDINFSVLFDRIKLYIHDTNKCSFRHVKYNLTSLLHIVVSVTCAQGALQQDLKLTEI